MGFQEGRFYDAVTNARRGLAVGGGNKALLMLGKIYRTTGEYDRAVAAYDQILRKTPNDSAGPGGPAQGRRAPWVAPPATRPARAK